MEQDEVHAVLAALGRPGYRRGLRAAGESMCSPGSSPPAPAIEP